MIARARETVAPGRVEAAGERVRIDVERRLVHIDEHRRRTDPGDRLRRRRER